MVEGALQPRKAVLRMRPYSPPTGGRADKLRLDFNENTVGPSPKVAQFLKEAAVRTSPAVYPEYSAVKASLARYFQVEPEQFLLTNGTDEAIQVLVNTYVDDGDEVIILRPSYAMYRFYSELAGAEIREIDYQSGDLSFPLEEVLAAVTPRTKAIFISNPNNPTGTGLSLQSINKILHYAPHAAVLIDEAYYEFSGITALEHLEDVENLFVSRTFSKVFGLAGLRIGCLFSQQENVQYLHKAQSPYSVNSIAAAAAKAAVEDTAYVAQYVGEVLAARELLYVGLEKLKIPYVKSKANFVLMDVGSRSIELRDKLKEKGVLVRDRSYEIPGGLRVTVGTREQMRRFLSELEQIW